MLIDVMQARVANLRLWFKALIVKLFLRLDFLIFYLKVVYDLHGDGPGDISWAVQPLFWLQSLTSIIWLNQKEIWVFHSDFLIE